MILAFDEDELVYQLGLLQPQRRIIFAASSATRLFSTRSVLGRSVTPHAYSVLEDALNVVWTACAHGGSKGLETQLGNVMAVLPNADTSSWTREAEYLDDLGAAVAYAVRSALTFDSKEAAWAARRVYEALDRYIISRDSADPNEINFELKINADPLIQKELLRQRRDIQELSTAELSEGYVSVFRIRAESESVASGGLDR